MPVRFFFITLPLITTKDNNVMKKTLITALLTAIAAQGTAQADDGTATTGYAFLMLATTSGMKTTMAVEGLEITVNGSQIVAANNAERRTFSLSDLATMQFTNETVATAIDAATMPDDDEGVDVFSLSGMALGHYTSIDDCRDKLTPGVYVVRQAGKTTKTQLR